MRLGIKSIIPTDPFRSLKIVQMTHLLITSSGSIYGDNIYWHENIKDSYGLMLALRTSITLAARLGWIPLAVSATASMSATIPTAKLNTGGFALRTPVMAITRG